MWKALINIIVVGRTMECNINLFDDLVGEKNLIFDFEGSCVVDGAYTYGSFM